KIDIKKISPASLLVNGDNGLGHVVTYYSLKKGIKIAKENGISSVAIHSSNHFGTASYFCQLASQENIIAFICTNSPPGLAPWGGSKKIFGTNPVAFGFPVQDRPPVIIDMSTSVVARGKIMLAKNRNESIPDGWALDEKGNMTNNPSEALKGSMYPMAEAKGYALALAVEILAGVLTGASISPDVKNIYNEKLSKNTNVGHFMFLIDVNKYKNNSDYDRQLKYLLQLIKLNPPIKNDVTVRYPGERKHAESRQREANGIKLSETDYNELRELGKRFNIQFPE